MIRYVVSSVVSDREQAPVDQARAEAGELAFGTIDSWLIWKLTGGRVHVSDPSNAARTMLFDIRRGVWDDDLLALFARHPNRPLNRDQIMEQAHNRGWDVFDRSIDLRVMRLRRKIERNPDKPELIKTVRNVGYVFVPDRKSVV